MDLNIRVVEDPETKVITLSFGFGDAVGYVSYKTETEMYAIRDILAAVCAGAWAADLAEYTTGSETTSPSVY